MSSHRTRSSRRPRTAAAAVLVLLGLTACSSSDGEADTAAPVEGTSVRTTLLDFDPKEVTVAKGDTVTWVAGDDISHVLVQGSYEVGSDGLRTKETDDKAFELKLAGKGQQVKHTYSTAGTFTYYCTIHRGMNGTVTVS